MKNTQKREKGGWDCEYAPTPRWSISLIPLTHRKGRRTTAFKKLTELREAKKKKGGGGSATPSFINQGNERQ